MHCNNVVPSSPYKANCLLWAGYVTLIGSAVTQLRASLYSAQKTDISENAVVHIKSIVMQSRVSFWVLSIVMEVFPRDRHGMTIFFHLY